MHHSFQRDNNYTIQDVRGRSKSIQKHPRIFVLGCFFCVNCGRIILLNSSIHTVEEHGFYLLIEFMRNNGEELE